MAPRLARWPPKQVMSTSGVDSVLSECRVRYRFYFNVYRSYISYLMVTESAAQAILKCKKKRLGKRGKKVSRRGGRLAADWLTQEVDTQ